MSVPYTITEKAIGVVVAYRPHVIPPSHPNYEKIRELVKLPGTTEADIAGLVDIPKAIHTFTGGNVTVVNGRLFYKGFEVRNSLANLILRFVKDGEALAAKPFEAFLEKAFENPDPRAAMDLYDWVAASGLPITPDGDILAWKAVAMDYTSLARKGNKAYDHHPGNVVEEDRTQCDPDPNQTCSRGLHFCSAPYLRNYAGGGSRVVVVKINPRDVVAFPRDYGWEKGRACRYEIVGEVSKDKVAEFYPQGRMVYTGYELTPATNGQFAVGDTWCDRNGQRTRITNVNGPKQGFPIVAANGRSFRADGKFAADGSMSPVDLVRKDC